ncbi:hypothetical protein COV88_00550 [Candidatus Saccharibacteria bacterium CG11_big_fil_rev_8_21_14_0_20_41_19]|nr:hypothetical protein [Candidatus Saccharibacteria bacterium]OIP86153.1 MAG: hypothetical protein AUK57_00025 [Candidatus Saccharibacteria bacterium CG2_30_41_52]PIQ70964.1 MAG: hypothetical protein COV88_00550 [Candidatus Saccharibacteria bacterium CG11_big_fil_rev_8_21_14_0_20_41_19]PIZ60492.1 MAG: hypothetical protein COY18_01405 [Candidatus Saccharibacteria bacterium CG_4_10_14_0_2_um_filter_41_11]PJC29426.1 MAG: hypothetical protein CO052_03470 [Candidatus Saccharibacteria bacterium CG_4
MRKWLIITSVLILGLSLVVVMGQPTVAQSAGNIVVQNIPGPSVVEQLTNRVLGSWPWYLVRASGIVAAIVLVILMLSGIGLVTGHTFRFLEPITAWASHKALGIVFGISVLIHMIGLLFDHFVPFDIPTLLVPWLSSYKLVTIFGLQMGSLFVALGVLAFYGLILVVITSLLWIEKKPFLWKIIHLLSYLVMVFVFIHALYLGTDLASGLWRWVWIASGVIVAAAVVARLWRAKTI